MSGDAIDDDERKRRRIALLYDHFGVPRARAVYDGAVAEGKLENPVVCIAHPSSGAGFNLMKALGQHGDEAIMGAISLKDVHQVAEKCLMPHLTAWLTQNFVPGKFLVVLLAWEGTGMVYPDQADLRTSTREPAAMLAAGKKKPPPN